VRGSALQRRTFLSVMAGIAVTGTGAVVIPQISGGSPLVRPPIKYAFRDDFHGPAGSAPDPKRWTYDIGGGGWGNHELEIYTDSRENSFLDGHGHLVIRATKVVTWTGSAHLTTYYSARLKTLGLFSKYQGTFEARIKLAPRVGLWPAWWVMGENIGQVGWPACGEVDMLENYGDGYVQTSVHVPNQTDSGVLTKYGDIPVGNGWHVWRMVWDDAGFRFYRDGHAYLAVAPGDLQDWCFSSGVPMFMLLNLAVGGTVGTPPPSTKFPVDMLVDYVRVW
jgi:beta-glucanase (GH16 family)